MWQHTTEPVYAQALSNKLTDRCLKMVRMHTTSALGPLHSELVVVPSVICSHCIARTDGQQLHEHKHLDAWALLRMGGSLVGGRAHQQEVAQRAQRSRPGRRLAASARADGAAAGRPVHALSAGPSLKAMARTVGRGEPRSGNAGCSSPCWSGVAPPATSLPHPSPIWYVQEQQPTGCVPDRCSQRTCHTRRHPCRLLESCTAVHPDLLVACWLSPCCMHVAHMTCGNCCVSGRHSAVH